jgi:hypothetical protein
MPEAAMPGTWSTLVEEIEREIDGRGYWSGEALYLRNAAGRRRLGRVGGAKILAALAAAGFECDEPELRFESQPVAIRRAGGTQLAATIAELLPAIREADRMVPRNAEWRDEVVARTAIRAWHRPRA